MEERCLSLPLPSPTSRICSISASALCRSTFLTAFPARIASFATLLPSAFVKRFLDSGGGVFSVGEEESS